MVDGKHIKYSGQRLSERSINELIGLSHGLIADGVINQKETEYLQKWLAAQPTLEEDEFLTFLYGKINQVLADDFLDQDEADDIYQVLKSFVGGEFELGEPPKASHLPLCDPPPRIDIFGKKFCFTGSFVFGTRSDCHKAIMSLGGVADKNVTKKLNYLVIGEYATPSWLHSNSGRKALKAVDYRNSGIPISIVSENNWRTALEG